MNSPAKRMQINLTSKAKTNIITLVGAAFLIGVGLAALVIVLPLFSVFVERLLVHTNRNLVALLDFLH